MAIVLRNQLTQSDDYKVTDVSMLGVVYDSPMNRTIVSISSSDKRHDAIKIGDYFIPLRNDTPAGPNWTSFDIIHPLEELKVIDKSKVGLATRTLTIAGDARKYFPGGGSNVSSPESYNGTEITVDKIVRNRKYRITDEGSTKWSAFGNLYNSPGDQTHGSKAAVIGRTFIARASGSSANETASVPTFTISRFQGDETSAHQHDSPITITGITNELLTDINGQYRPVGTSKPNTYYQHINNDIAIQLRSSALNNVGGRWTIWNPGTGQVFFEDARKDSILTARFDSPALGSTFRGPVGTENTPSVSWNDRTVSVPAIDQAQDSNTANLGKVIEVAHVSSMFGANRPLSNSDLDKNFATLDNTKLASDGSQPLDGNLQINGSVSASSASITDSISVGGATAYSSNTGLTLGTKDLEVNNIRLSGIINDDALFRKYKVVNFPHSIIGDYNTKNKTIEPCTILFFSNVSGLDVANTITAIGNAKSGKVRRVNSEYGYVQVSETDGSKSFTVGDEISGKPTLGKILKVLNPSDYLSEYQNLRIFGLNQLVTPLKDYLNITESAASQPAKPSSAPVSTGKFTLAGTNTFAYRYSEFNILTGKVSSPSDASIEVGGAPNLESFDKVNYVQLTGLSRTDANHNILLYRKQGSVDGFKLCRIFDDKDLNGATGGGVSVNDYGGYDKANWSVLNSPSEQYTYKPQDNLTYLPVDYEQATTVTGFSNSGTDNYIGFVGGSHKYSKGFLDTRVAAGGPQASTNSPRFFRITETQDCLGNFSVFDSPNIDETHMNSPVHPNAAIHGAPYGKQNEIEFFIDNSRVIDSPSGTIIGGIQRIIQDAIADGTRTTTLLGGTYYTKLLTIPSNFKFSGVSDRNTTLKSIPWMSDKINTRTPVGGDVSAQNAFAETGTFEDGDKKKVDVEFFNETVSGEIGTGLTSDKARFGNLSRNDAELASSFGIFAGVVAGQKSYSRTIVEFDGKSDVEVSDIRLDGNGLNQRVTREDVSGKSNFILSGQLSKNVTLKNITVENSSGAGFYGEELSEAVLESSQIRNGGQILDDSIYSTGIFAPGSDKLRLNTNLIENFSSSNDLTSNQNSTLVGNIVRDTGSGVLAYATSNMVHEGNLILGAANEFIPMVDTLNSEYDAININIVNEAGASGATYESDVIEFLMNNSPKNMAPINVAQGYAGVSIENTIRTLVQKETSTYFLPDQVGNAKFNFTYGNPNDTSGHIIQMHSDVTNGYAAVGASLAAGNIGIKIPEANINEISQYANFGTLSSNYSPLDRPNGERLVGLAYDVTGTEYKFINTTDPIIWSKITIDNDTQFNESITFQIPANQASRIAIGDKIVYKVGIDPSTIGNANALSINNAASISGTDMNGNPKYKGILVIGKTVSGDLANIKCSISEAQSGYTAADRASLSSTGSGGLTTSEADPDATATELANCQLGVQSSFSIIKGRIIV